MGIRTILATLAVASGLSTPLVAADGEPTARLRYQLSPGKEFTFHSESRSGKDDGRTYLVDWHVWSIRPDPDGAWRMVIRCDLKSKQGKSPNQADQDRVDSLVWRCRMFDDGRLVDATMMGTVRDPYRLFPRLPSTPEARARGWESAGPDREGVTRHHRLKVPSTGGENLEISTSADGPQDKVYVQTHEYRATFNVARGVVTRVETEDATNYRQPDVTRGTIELVSVEDRGEKWASDFGEEADRYFKADEAYESTCVRASRDADRCKEILTEAKLELEKARAGFKTPVFLDAIGQKLASHDGLVNYQVAQAKDHATRLGKPAWVWEAKDIDGNPRRLSDYRGKVVVMDFWYRGCGWCMHAMPQVNQLSDRFRNDSVAVLGMSVDEDEKDARVVIEAMKLRYPTIKANDIPEKYGVSAYPTLVVVDKEGKVREIHVGYSPDLLEDISSLIRALLDEKPLE